MKKGGGGNKLPGTLQKAFDTDLGGYDKFKADFVAAGTTQFGSGWAWVSVKNGKLEISKTPNGENPLVHGATPILGVDVWEHSYYIDYRNAAAEIPRSLRRQPDQLGLRRRAVRKRPVGIDDCPFAALSDQGGPAGQIRISCIGLDKLSMVVINGSAFA